ncbi:hypothetical protein Pcinc_015636 [Petrolisthes cinctipes]|uniref:Amino acid transporter transmembrane domain-containing protein n=1 Tax=Petrolisthes cinctipes TaxID=88211 RepID=A0AAE1FTW9_PETCI|nr:hypothetical protein Pcinc_015636 [Petrolisthes cinctipes]
MVNIGVGQEVTWEGKRGQETEERNKRGERRREQGREEMEIDERTQRQGMEERKGKERRRGKEKKTRRKGDERRRREQGREKRKGDERRLGDGGERSGGGEEERRERGVEERRERGGDERRERGVEERKEKGGEEMRERGVKERRERGVEERRGRGVEEGQHQGVGGREKNHNKGLSVSLAAFFLVTQVVGGGFVVLPKALAHTGWIGVSIMVMFCLMVSYSGTRLATCWVILEERWPHRYSHRSTQPYVEIADTAFGKHGRCLGIFVVIVGSFGPNTVYLVLTASLLNSLVGELSTCEWVLVTAAVLLPFTWLGTPKDFWQVSVASGIVTTGVCLTILCELLKGSTTNTLRHKHPPHHGHLTATPYTFVLGFATLLFSYGGARGFPTIQNDMEDRTQFWKSVVLGNVVILALYLPIAVTGYAILGHHVPSDILFSLDPHSPTTKAVIVLQILNLLGTYITGFNPTAQGCEDLLMVQKSFGWGRVGVRSGLVALQALVGLAVPLFDRIMTLFGASVVPLATLILPPLVYMKLINMNHEPHWPQRQLPLWEKVVLWELVSVGVLGGVVGTVSAVLDLLKLDTEKKSCFLNFHPS